MTPVGTQSVDSPMNYVPTDDKRRIVYSPVTLGGMQWRTVYSSENGAISTQLNLLPKQHQKNTLDLLKSTKSPHHKTIKSNPWLQEITERNSQVHQ